MPGLRGMARTAAVVGTATATRNAVNRRQADKNAQAYAQATSKQLMHRRRRRRKSSTLRWSSRACPRRRMITQLERLGALKAQGLLTEEEFAAAKAKLLAS